MKSLKGRFLIAVLGLVVLAGGRVWAGIQDAGSKAAAPAFKTEKAKAEFDKAQSLYKEGEYKDASSAFKKAARGAASTKDKKLVESWVKACDGARYVGAVKKLMEQNRLQAAHAQLAKIQRRCLGNPSESLLMEVVGELDKRLFVMLENFDQRSGRYTAKYGKTWINDPRIVIRGKQCLRWTNTKDGKPGMLKVTTIPQEARNLTRFDAIEFWMSYTIPPAAQVVILCGKAQKKDKGTLPQPRQPGVKVQDAFFGKVAFAQKKGWQLVRLKLNTFQASGNPTLADVKDIRIQIPRNKAFDFYIDDIRLMRKDPPAEKSSGRRR